MSITENEQVVSNLVSNLQELVGTAVVTATQPELEAVAVDGKTPQASVTPTTSEQAAQVLKWANEQGLKVAVRGSGTKIGLGNIISQLDLVLNTTHFNQILEHVPGDLTIGVQAGANLQMIQDELEKYEQFLPVDSPLSSQATVGGAVATNSSGPLRLQYGPTRDWLIGVKFVLADGTQAKAGGRVVKNVAGFDVMKVFAGSLGTLGFITEMNFKLMPLPKAFTTLLLTMPDEKVAAHIALKIIRAGLFPASLTVLDAQAAKIVGLDNIPAGQAVLAVEVRNTKLAVERQVRDIYQLVIDEVGKPVTYTDLTERSTQKEWTRKLTDFAYRPELDAENSFALKLALLPTQTADALKLARNTAAKHQIEIAAISQAGHGLSYITGQISDTEAAFQTVTEITDKIQKLGGTVTAERIPLEIKRRLPDVWGSALTEGELKLMRSVKQTLDPHNTLNPGRFVGMR